MLSATERYATRWDTLTFIFCLVLSLLIRFSPDSFTDALATGIRGTILAPLLSLEVLASSQKNSRLTHAKIVAERDSLAMIVLGADRAVAENMQLRRLLDLSDALPVRHVSAEVVHESSPAEGLAALLSVGSRDGVKVLSPVISPDGLVGIVQSVNERVSVMWMWPHPEFRVHVMTEDASLFGNAQAASRSGASAPLMEINGVPYRDRVSPGTVVYTSGLGGVWPRGIVVGTILDDTSEPSGWERTYLVHPRVHPGSISHVIVLIEPLAELRALFETGDVFPP